MALALLRARRASTGPDSAPGAGTGRGDGTEQPAPAYPDVVAGLRNLIRSHVPAGAEVLVVSRGDPDLVDLEPCRGRHFPADRLGVWAGHHPALGGAAELLEAQRGAADHLAVPATGAWWFGTYPELVEYLAQGRCLAEIADIGSVWELPRRRPDPPADPTPEILAYRTATAHGRALVDAVAGEGATVAVLSRGDPDLVDFHRCRGRHFPADDGGVYAGHPADDADARAWLDRAVASGVSWLWMPEHAEWWSRAYPGFWHHLHDAHRPVLRRTGVGHLFRLVPTRGSA
jgi:hypothetical protein